MQTAATYLIAGDADDKPKICYYSFLGCPKESAGYFWNMHHVKNFLGGYATRFLRGNDRLDFTSSHESHSDTGFRYTLYKEGHLTASRFHADSVDWKVFYEGPWYEFVNLYHDSDEKLYLFPKNSSCLSNDVVLTLAEAKFYAYKKRLVTAFYARYRCTEKNVKNYDQEAAKYLETQINHIIQTSSVSLIELGRIKKIEILQESSEENSIFLELKIKDITSTNSYTTDMEAQAFLHLLKDRHYFLSLIKKEYDNLYQGFIDI